MSAVAVSHVTETATATSTPRRRRTSRGRSGPIALPK